MTTLIHRLWTERGFVAVAFSTVLVIVLGHTLFAHISSHSILAALFVWLFGVIIWASFGVVRHAEALAARFGEPYGTLILTISVTCIEVLMIAAVMSHDDPDPTAARDTIYSVQMIIINGLIGLAILLGGIKHGEQKYNLKSSSSYFSMLLAIIGLALFLPNFIPAASRNIFQLFLIIVSVLLYFVFLRIQMIEHRHFFAFETESAAKQVKATTSGGWTHAVFLIGTLAGIAWLAESLAIVLDEGVDLLGAPQEVAALAIALLILAPESLTAIRAGLKNQMQRVVNIGLGSALATLSLTVPLMLVIGRIRGQEIELGVTPLQGAMLVISFLIGINNYRAGETNLLQGAIHFVLFATFIFLIFL